MSCASRRQTTRIEDTAYCLLGIFGVHMSPRYGERNKAFIRLQISIITQHTPDPTIFAWTDSDASRPLIRGLLADSPGRFQGCFSLERFEGDSSYRPLRATPQEVEVHTPVLQHLTTYRYFFLPVCSGVGISLRKVGVNTFARTNPSSLDRLGQDSSLSRDYSSFLSVPSVIQAGTLPNRFPFHHSDAVLGCRYGILMPRFRHQRASRDVLEFHVFVPPGLGGPFPLSNWDSQDGLFFSTEGRSWGWSIFSFRFKTSSESTSLGPEFFVACFNWNSDCRIRILAFSDSLIGNAEAILLKSRLASLGFGYSHEVDEMVHRLCGDGYESDSIRTETPVAVENPCGCFG